MSRLDAAPRPAATHRRRTPQAASRIAPLISELASCIQSTTGPFGNRLDRDRTTLHPVRTTRQFSHELAIALAMVLPLEADPKVLRDELRHVPFAGEWLRLLLSSRPPAPVVRAVVRLQQAISEWRSPLEPHAWCEQLLHACDDRRRRSHGFYLTPEPLARFVVSSVHDSLRDWCGLPRGLAEDCTWNWAVDHGAAPSLPPGIDPKQPFLTFLDPSAGTGVFLAQVVRSIHEELHEQWAAQGVPQPECRRRWSSFAVTLIPRLRGIEVMIGPYAVAHLQLRRLLRETGVELPAGCVLPLLLADALATPEEAPGWQHATEAWRVRSSGETTVVVGNPPFSGAARPGGVWIEQLMADYKVSVRAEERQIQRLSNLYVRFLRLVQWMATRSGLLVAGLVTDRGWGEGVLFRDARRSWLLQASSMSWIDLGGAGAGRESRGELDESLFDIRQPTAVTIARLGASGRSSPASVGCSSVRGSLGDKLAWMQRARPAEPAQVPAPSQYRFAPSPVLDDYASWPSLLQWAGTGDPASDRDHRYGTGVKTRHDSFVVAMTPSEAVDHVQRIARSPLDDDSLAEQLGLCTTAHFDLARARTAAEQDRSLLERMVAPLWFRPFDARHVVYDRAFICEPKVRLMRHLLEPGNASLAVLRQDRTGRAAGSLVSRGLVSKDMVSSRDDALIWPLYVGAGAQRMANVSPDMLERLSACTGLGHREGEDGGFSAWDVLGYIYAILWAPSYRKRHAQALCCEFPHLPLPSSGGVFTALSKLGSRLCRLHLDPTPAPPQGNAGPGCRIEQVRWEAYRSRVWLGPREWLQVPAEVWGLFVGNHAVCRGWLQARQGRNLERSDLDWFGGVVHALQESLQTGIAVDAAIEQHGGWQGAFTTGF